MIDGQPVGKGFSEYMNQAADDEHPSDSNTNGVSDKDIESWDSTLAENQPSPDDGTMVQKKKEEKVEGDGRKTKKPQGETKGKWGHHEPVREKPEDRDKDKFKPWKKK